MPDLYETYIRTAQGETYHPEDIRKGMEDFLGPNGYRISFNIEGVVISLRRDIVVTDDIAMLDERLDQESVNCVVTIRGHK